MSMYMNIDLDHAMQALHNWMKVIPENFQDWDNYHRSQQAILEGLNLVIQNNLMQLRDTNFLQLIGTAMGTSVAVIFTNLYYGWHERTFILPHYNTLEPSPSVFY